MTWKSLLSCFLLCVALVVLHAQSEINQVYLDYIESGKKCLIAGDSLCQEYFDLALASAKESKNDSVIGSVYIETYNAMKIAGADYNTLMSVLRQGLDFGGLQSSPHIMATLYAEMGNTILDYGRKEDYMAYYDSARTFAFQGVPPFTTSQILIARARGLEVQGKLDECIRELLLANTYADKVGKPTGKAQIALGLSNAYYMNGDFALAKKQLEICQELLLEAGDTLRYYYAKTNWSNVCLSMDQPEAVVDELPAAVEYFRSSGHIGLTPYPLTQLGRAYEMLNRNEEALKVLLESQESCRSLGLETQFAYNSQILAHVYLALGNKEEALKSAIIAYDHFKERGETAEYLDASETYAKMLEAKGLYSKAYIILKDLIADKDSLYTEEKMKEIAEIQSLLDLEQKESQLCAQENEIAILEQEKIVSRNRIMGLVLGFILLSIIAWLLLKQKSAQVKLKQSKNEQLQMSLEHQKRELTSKALHLAQKNEFLLSLKEQLQKATDKGENEAVKDLMTRFKFEQQVDKNWDQFMTAFKESSPALMKELHSKHPDLTKKEVQLCALARMGLTIKEIASMLNVTPDAVKKARYRLRKKIELSSDKSLESYLQSLV